MRFWPNAAKVQCVVLQLEIAAAADLPRLLDPATFASTEICAFNQIRRAARQGGEAMNDDSRRPTLGLPDAGQAAEAELVSSAVNADRSGDKSGGERRFLHFAPLTYPERSFKARREDLGDWLWILRHHPISAVTGHYRRNYRIKLEPGQRDEITKEAAARIAGENESVNRRMVWMLTLQGFLFAAFGLTIGARAVGRHDANTHLVATFQGLVMWAGLLSAVLALVGILSAQSSINDLKGRWLAAVPGDDHAVPPFSGPLQSLGARLNTFGLCAVLVGIWAVALHEIAAAPVRPPSPGTRPSASPSNFSPTRPDQMHGGPKATQTPPCAALPVGKSKAR
jgi:hypothetical protein